MNSPVPNLTLDGVLPPGDYVLTFSDLRASLLVSDPGNGQSPGHQAIP